VALGYKPSERIVYGHASPGDGSRARSAVRLQDITVDAHRELAESKIVDHSANAPADEPLNLLSATA
jgi:hypothetical protein